MFKVIQMLSMLQSHELFLATKSYGSQQNNSSMYVSLCMIFETFMLIFRFYGHSTLLETCRVWSLCQVRFQNDSRTFPGTWYSGART